MLPRGSNRRWHSADEPHEQSERDTSKKQVRRHSKGKREIAKSLEIHGAGRQPVQRDNQKAPQRAAQEGNQQRFHQKGQHYAASAEAKRSHGSDLARAFR